MARATAVRWAWSPLVLLLAACVETTAPPLEPSVEGFWLGTSQGFLLALELTEEDGLVTGTGTIMKGIPITFTVRDGSHSFPNLSLIGDLSPRFTPFRLTAEVFEGHIAATLNGSGFRDFDVHLMRY